MSTYFKNISEGISTTLTGMRLTLRHLWSARNRRKPGDIRSDNFYDQHEGMVTIQYPLETIPIPDNGRYRLHNEIDDCIVCDKCVKVCPVDCIDIEPIRAIEEVGRASDGSPIRLYAAKFDIDMAKCCYCGLCTTVCPTECLTMTKTFDYSELDVRDMVYNYANLTAAEADEKRMLLDQFQKEKEALKAVKKPVLKAEEREEGTTEEKPAVAAKPAFQPRKPVIAKVEEREEGTTEEKPVAAKPAFQPRKPVIAKTEGTGEGTMEEKPVVAKPVSETSSEAAPVKPAFRPTMKPKVVSDENVEKPVSETSSEAAPAKPAFRPTMKPKVVSDENVEKPVSETSLEAAPAKPAFRPTMKPKTEIKVEAETEKDIEPEIKEGEEVKPKVVFRPTMKPKTEIKAEAETEKDIKPEIKEGEEVKPKAVFRPTMKPKTEIKVEAETEKDIEPEIKEGEEVKPKAVFRPTMKPKPSKE